MIPSAADLDGGADVIFQQDVALPILPEAPKPGLIPTPSQCLTGLPTCWTNAPFKMYGVL